MPDEFVKLDCPSCQRRLRIPHAQLHRKIGCPQCQTKFRLSSPRPAPNAPQPPPAKKSRPSTIEVGNSIFDLDYDEILEKEKNTKVAGASSAGPEAPQPTAGLPNPEQLESPSAPSGLVSRGPVPTEDGDDIYRPEKPTGYKSSFEGSIEYKLAPAADQVAQRELFDEAHQEALRRSALFSSRITQARFNNTGVALILLGIVFCIGSLLAKKFFVDPLILSGVGTLAGLAGAGCLAAARKHQGIVGAITGALFGGIMLVIGVGSIYLHSKSGIVDNLAANEAEADAELDPVQKHARELERIAEEKRKNRPILDKFDNVINEPAPDEQGPKRNGRGQLDGLPQNPFRQQPKRDEGLEAEEFENQAHRRAGPAFRIINGDPDGEFAGDELGHKPDDNGRDLFAPDQDEEIPHDKTTVDTESEEGDLVDQFNQMLGGSVEGNLIRQPRQGALVGNRWETANDVVEAPHALNRYDVSEILGEKAKTGRAMTHRNPILGFDFVDDLRLIWISPLFENDPVAVESLAPNDPTHCLAGIKIAFLDDKIVGAQAIFAPRLGNVLDLNKTETSIWRGERTKNVKTCISNGSPIYGMVIYRGTRNVVGVSLLSR